MKNIQVLLILFSLCFLWGAGAETAQLEEVDTSIYETCMDLCTGGKNGFEDPLLFHQCNNICINEVKVKELKKFVLPPISCDEQIEVLRSVLSEEQIEGLRSVLSEEQIEGLRSIGAVDRKKAQAKGNAPKNTNYCFF